MSNVRALVACEESIAVVTGRPRSGRRTFRSLPRGPFRPLTWAVRPASGRPAEGRQRSKRGTVVFGTAIQARENDRSHQRDIRENASSTAPQNVRVRIEPRPSGSRVAAIKVKMHAGSFGAPLRQACANQHSQSCQAVPRSRNSRRRSSCIASRALTLPSRGRPTSGFASCRPPLMSNVRRHKASQLRSHLAITA